MMRACCVIMLVARVAAADPTPVATADSEAVPAPAPVAPPPAPTPALAPAPSPVPIFGLPLRHGISPELTISGGIRIYDNDGDQTRWWFARARAGLAIYREPGFLLVGIAGQLGPLASSALGIEAEVLQSEVGVWVQGGVYPLDSAGGVTVTGAVGFSLFGLEYQRRVSGDHAGDDTLCLMVALPLGVVRVMRKPPEGVVIVPTAAPM
jgi:hypothetical protein